MKKLAISILASMFLATSTFAGGMTVGVSGGLIQVNADGTETTTAVISLAEQQIQILHLLTTLL